VTHTQPPITKGEDSMDNRIEKDTSEAVHQRLQGAGQEYGVRIMDRHAFRAVMLQKAHDLETRARAIRRISEIVSAVSEREPEVYATILSLIKE
jgi:hypothetical protein